jgi:hypothetical protein
MSAKPCENYKIIMVNYDDLWLVHTQVASQLKDVKLELRELKSHSFLLAAYTSCSMLRSNLEACAIEIEDLKHQIDHSCRYSILSPPCEMCVKDRRWRPEGGEWEPIKIPHRNLAYIPKSTRTLSLLTRSRPSSYRQAIGLRSWARN